ncbi:MAG: phosphatase PAP2 family protein [Planctomycetaceae bacterium]|nr:phosphatase PAP2 family protein [Planctomycetaceae bacterium]
MASQSYNGGASHRAGRDMAMGNTGPNSGGVMKKSLAARTAVALTLGVALVVLCYYFVDRPVAWFVHAHSPLLSGLLRWPPLVSECLKSAAPAVIAIVILWWLWKRGGRLQAVLLAISANVIVTTLLKQFLKWSCGRYWPETWKQNNPSLIRTGDYGFHPFHSGVAFESFPSGHAAVICSALSILWLAYPRWRWCYAVVGVTICVAMVGTNYHFVGDVVAGAMLGSITGVWMAHLFRLHPRPEHLPNRDEGGCNDVRPAGQLTGGGE